MKTIHTSSTLSPVALLLAAVCLGLVTVSAQAPRGTTDMPPPANDPLGTVPMPVTNGTVPPGANALPPDEAATTASASTAAVASTSTKTNADGTILTAGAMSDLTHADRHFIKKVAEGGQLEIAMANLALQRASNSDVRSYAQMIVTDHTAMAAQLAQLAARKGIQADIAEYRATETTADTMATAKTDWSDPTTNRHYRQLAASSAANFDQAFIAAMVSDHTDDVALFDHKSQKADDVDVRSFAASNLETLHRHLDRALQLQRTPSVAVVTK